MLLSPDSRGLPPIPFGQASAVQFTDEAACGAFLSRLPDAPSRFGAIGPSAAFRVSLRNVSLPGVSLVAGASSPKATDHWSRRLAVVIPFGGSETVLRSGRDEFRWAAPHHAFFIPAGRKIEAESTAGAFLRLDIVEATLRRTIAGMIGAPASTVPAVDLASPRIVPLRVRGVNWLPAIRALCGTIDAFECDARRLATAGLDDVVLRTVVMMLQPELFFEPRSGERTAPALDLDALLERITAELASRVTLGDLEAWSGCSARTIQIAFRKRFGAGPMEWIRDRRLDLVRARLLAASPGATVREIAVACGLPRMATLVPEYTKRFGELPSETLRRTGGAS